MGEAAVSILRRSDEPEVSFDPTSNIVILLAKPLVECVDMIRLTGFAIIFASFALLTLVPAWITALLAIVPTLIGALFIEFASLIERAGKDGDRAALHHSLQVLKAIFAFTGAFSIIAIALIIAAFYSWLQLFQTSGVSQLIRQSSFLFS